MSSLSLFLLTAKDTHSILHTELKPQRQVSLGPKTASAGWRSYCAWTQNR